MSTVCPRCALPLPADAPHVAACPRCLDSMNSASIASLDGGDPFQTSEYAVESRVRATWGDSLPSTSPVGATLRFEGRGDPSEIPSLSPRPRLLRTGRASCGLDASADYELLDELGEGGMGIVYAARQTSIDRMIAVKMLKPRSANDRRACEKFLAEAAVTGDLDHPNIVPIHELGTSQDGSVFYSMKRVQGKSWQDLIAEKTIAENLEILLRTADAVAFAHARGIVHRDLKPENVMLGDFGEVLVMDWGLAISTCVGGKAQALSRAESAGGTPAYMAPEMAMGVRDRIGPLSDVYLLGAILYQIVTGRPPHTGETVLHCLCSAGRNIIVPTDAEGELVEIARRAMATNPAERYATVQAFQAAVRSYQSHAESIHLATAARNRLGEAKRTRNYDEFSQALFGFRESLKLWSDYPDARLGLSQTQRAYAEAALDRGDFQFALSLLEGTDPEHEEVRTRIRYSIDEYNSRQARIDELRDELHKRLARQSRLRGVVRALAGFVALAFVGLTAYSLWVVSARDASEEERRAVDQSLLKAKIELRTAAEAVERANARAAEAERRLRAFTAQPGEPIP